jgi:hypothetical protein
MKPDPMDNVIVTQALVMPATTGRGSSKDAWITYAMQMRDNCVTLWSIIDRQSETIRQLNAEIDLLRDQIAKRKPKGGRPRTPDTKVAAIEADIVAGYSRRQAASRNGVTAMTVTRIAKRMQDRGV